MSTHARIIIERELTESGETVYESIYLHRDGYPDHAGKMLKNHYSSWSSAAQLIGMGDMSSLAADLESSEFYGRDRNEVYIDSLIDPDIDRHMTERYNYLFRDGEWFFVGPDRASPHSR